ncbi:nucleotide exchange factor GrpE [Plantactinospora sp. B5E13]|uniref:nucleotide exchange factor GrpE n=1 Tax=unclassified Plantactinospora TaxID=2631981 RepID=UPI00325C3D98
MTEKPRAADPETTGSTPGGSAPDGGTDERIVIRDKRKINVAGSTGTTGQTNGAKPAVKDPNPDPEPSAVDAEPVVAAGEVDDTGSTDAAVAVDDATAPDGGPEVPDSTATDADETDRADAGPAGEPGSPVVDDAEIAEVLEAEQPSGTEGPVVDAPAEPVTEPVDEQPAPLRAELGALRAELDERTRDLQRVTAEYANYRKRVDRDRGSAAKETTGKVLTALLPVLDDLDRAREHGDLVGPFGTVAEQLIGTLTKLGLTPFGEKGDPFDPNRHEAVAHLTSADVTEPTCVDVMRRGYEFGDKVLRAALVAVADPE